MEGGHAQFPFPSEQSSLRNVRTLVPLTAMPEWAAFLSRLLVPVAPGVEAVRDLLAGHELTALPSGWGLGWLILQPLLLLAAGVVLFARLERRAKRRGTLGRY